MNVCRYTFFLDSRQNKEKKTTSLDYGNWLKHWIFLTGNKLNWDAIVRQGKICRLCPDAIFRPDETCSMVDNGVTVQEMDLDLIISVFVSKPNPPPFCKSCHICQITFERFCITAPAQSHALYECMETMESHQRKRIHCSIISAYSFSP